MKSFRRLSLGFFVALAAGVLLSATAQAATIQNKAVVRAIRGTAQISNNKGASWVPARVGAQMGAATIIKTAAGSSADLFLGENGPVVRVTDDTQLTIDKLDLENTGIEKVIETQLDLKNGRILGSVKKMAAASKYEVKTPVGVAGIRGTEYSIASNGNINVVSGTVVVVYVVNGVIQPAVTVQAGQQTAAPVAAGQTPTVTSMAAATLATATAEVTTIMVGITTTPTGTITATLDGGGTVGTTPTGTTGTTTTGTTTTGTTTTGTTTTGTTTTGTTTTGTTTTGTTTTGTTTTGTTTTGTATTGTLPPPDTTTVPISNSGRTTN